MEAGYAISGEAKARNRRRTGLATKVVLAVFALLVVYFFVVLALVILD